MNRFKIEENESETVTSPTQISEPIISEPVPIISQTINESPEDKFKVIELPPVNQIETFENEKNEINQDYVIPQEDEKDEIEEEPPHKFFGHRRGGQQKKNLQSTEIVEYEKNKKPNVGLFLLGGGLLATLAVNFL